jgi:hypothetical protein
MLRMLAFRMVERPARLASDGKIPEANPRFHQRGRGLAMQDDQDDEIAATGSTP